MALFKKERRKKYLFLIVYEIFIWVDLFKPIKKVYFAVLHKTAPSLKIAIYFFLIG